MGRKQKLRQEKRNIKNKAAAAEVTAAAAEVTAAAAANAAEEKALALEDQLPKSDMYVQALYMADTDNITRREQFELFKQGATEDACIHSICLLYTSPSPRDSR